MSSGYTKLFSDIVDSSIWSERDEVRIVWVTMLALCDADGFIRGSVNWLAHKARVSPNDCQEALAKFEAPDPISRTPDNEGRRIQTVEHGWLILNHHIFRARNGLSSDPRRVYQREWMKNKRARLASQHVSTMSTMSTPASASASVDGKGSGENQKFENFTETPSWDEFWTYCQSQACLLPAEWYANDKFLAAEQDRWQKKSDWRAYARRVKGWWEADGRPMKPKEKHATNQRISEKRIDRSIGTANEGISSQYGEFAARKARRVGGVAEAPNPQ